MTIRTLAKAWLCSSLLCCSAYIQVSEAGEVISIGVQRNEIAYDLTIEAQIEAPPQAVYALLTDYANLTRISSSVTQSRVIERLDVDVHRIAIVTRLCVLFFCKDLRQTQDMYQGADGLLTAKLIPQDSDYNGGSARWQLGNRQGGTHLLFNASLEPNFWIPPLIGPMLLRHMLSREAVNTVAGIERLYAEQQARGLE